MINVSFAGVCLVLKNAPLAKRNSHFASENAISNFLVAFMATLKTWEIVGAGCEKFVRLQNLQVIN